MKTVLITGIGKGIGRALTQKFLQEGWHVVGTSLTGQADLKNDELEVFHLDLREKASIEKCSQDILALRRKIDVHINNAGVLFEKENEEPYVNIEILRNTLEVNLIGAVDFMQRVIPIINDGGHIISMSSRMGSLGSYEDGSKYASYRISKTALNMMTKSFAEILKGKVTVSSISPGWVKTDMGGPDAELEPEEAAKDIFDFAISNPETGQFWYKGKKIIW